MRACRIGAGRRREAADTGTLSSQYPGMPQTPLKPAGHYESVVVHGGIAYVSLQLPRVGNELRFVGRVGRELTTEQGCEAARVCAMRALAVLDNALGSRMRIIRMLRVSGHIAGVEDFTEQSYILDAASVLFERELGPRGAHARSVFGVHALPGGAPVGIEIQVAVHD